MLNYIAVVQHDGTASSITYRMGTNAFIRTATTFNFKGNRQAAFLDSTQRQFYNRGQVDRTTDKTLSLVNSDLLLPYPLTEDQSSQLAQTHICPIL